MTLSCLRSNIAIMLIRNYLKRSGYKSQVHSQGASLGAEEPPSQIKDPQFYQKGPLFCLKKPQICQKGPLFCLKKPQICQKGPLFC